MTYQEIFEAVWNGLASQDFSRSINDDGTCCYRDGTGKKCAAGWLIPDEDYKEKWDDVENEDESGGLSNIPYFSIKFPQYNQHKMISELQLAHDQASSTVPLNMRIALAYVANQYEIDTSKLANFPTAEQIENGFGLSPYYLS